MKYIVYYRNSYAASEPIRIDGEYENLEEAIDRAQLLNDASHPAWVQEEN